MSRLEKRRIGQRTEVSHGFLNLFRYTERDVNSPRRLLAVCLASVAALLVAAAVVIAPALGAPHASLTTGIVDVETSLGYAGDAAAGTGMILTSSGEVLTNNHVIRGATQIRVRIPQTGRTYGARVVGYDIPDDVAVLQLSGASGLRTVSLGDSSKVRVGQRIIAVGNTGGQGSLTSATGTVTGLDRTITVSDERGGAARLRHLIRVNASLRPGDSGGPLFDSSHHVVGMNAAASAELAFRPSGDGYAIPSNRAASIARQIESGRASTAVHIGATAFLGVVVQAASPARGDVATGDLVTLVRPGSPAAHGGLASGDVIVSVAGHTVRSPAGLVGQILRRKPGDKVRVVWVNQAGSRQTAIVTLASGPPQ
jgi:S1-C subfamily serine protease